MAGPRGKNLVEILILAKNLAGKELGQAEGQMAKLGEQASKTSKLMLAAGAAITTGLFAITKQTAKTIDEYRKFERATGVQVNTLAALRFAIQRWGGTQRDADTSLRRLTKAIADGGSGLESYLRVWRRLGLSQQDLVGPDGTMAQVQALLPTIADRFAVITDATLKADAAQILFGRGGLRLIPLLNQGAAGLEKMADRAKRLGRFFGEQTLDNAEAFQDAMLDIQHAVQGVGFAIGSALIPAVTNANNRITEHLIHLREWMEDNGALVRTVAAAAVANVGAGGLLFGITKLAVAFRLLGLATGIAAGPLGIALTVITALGAAIFKAKLDNLAQPRTMREVRAELDATNKEIERLTGNIQKIEDKALFDEGFSPRGPAGALRAGSSAQDITDKKKLEEYIIALERATERARRLKEELEAPQRAEELQKKIEEERARHLARAAKQAAQLRKDLEGSDEMFAMLLSAQPKGTGLVLEIDHLRKKVARLKVEWEQSAKAAHDAKEQDERFIELGEEAKKKLKEYAEAVVALNGKIRESDDAFRAMNERIREQQGEIGVSQTIFTRMIEVHGQLIATMKAMAETMRIAQSSIGAGLQAAFSRTLVAGNKFRDSFNALWRSIAQTVISAISQIIAKMIVMRAVFGLLSTLFPGSFVALSSGGFGPGILSDLGTLIPVGMASGGKIMGGRYGRDTVPLLGQKGENIIDRHSNDRLNAFLDGVEDGNYGGGVTQIFTGLYTGTRQENQAFQTFQRRSSSRFTARHIAKGMR